MREVTETKDPIEQETRLRFSEGNKRKLGIDLSDSEWEAIQEIAKMLKLDLAFMTFAEFDTKVREIETEARKKYIEALVHTVLASILFEDFDFKNPPAGPQTTLDASKG